jgi:2-dehydropantoate 2-reductase
MMNIGIIGAGAIGLLYAYQFSALFPVTLYTRRPEQCKQLKDKGITLVEEDIPVGNRQVTVKHLSEHSELEEEIIIVAVKQYALQDIMPYLLELNMDQSVLFLQNGMAHVKQAKKIENAHLLIGVVEHGVKKLDDVTVNWTGKGLTKVAPFRSDSTDSRFLNMWEKGLTKSFRLQKSNSYQNILVEKLVVNAIINPLTTLYRVKNGQLVHNRFYKETMFTLYREISFLIELEERDRVWGHVVGICSNTAENWSSMQRDIEFGRRTEVDAILGYLIFLAEEQGEKVPLTEFIYRSIKGLEEDNLHANQ